MLTLFRRWASTNDDTQAPDIIFIGWLWTLLIYTAHHQLTHHLIKYSLYVYYIFVGATVHHVSPKNNITLKMYENLLENELAPLMKQSLAAHPHQELIWLKPSLTIEHHANSLNSLHQDKMKKYTDILPRIFKYNISYNLTLYNLADDVYIHSRY